MPEFPEVILESTSDKICVVAVPGSGKTSRILIPKAYQILADQNIDKEEVLVLTFSRLSALDLKKRVKALDRAPRATTVHSFCLAFLLSENNHQIRKRVESILLEFEKESLLSDLKLIFPKRNKKKLRDDLIEFSAAWAVKPHDSTFEEDEYRRAFKSAVTNWLSEHEAVLMEEIVYFAVDLAKKLDSSEFLDRPKYIFVDEYQDLNRLEQEFVDILARDSQLLVVVGDPDQSIYSFKHAFPEGILEFSGRDGVEPYSHLVTGRCARRIVKVAKDLLSQGEPEREDFIQCPAEAIDGEVHFVRKNDQGDEFEFVANSISERLRNGVPAKDIIVLVPRQKLGSQFVEYGENVKVRFGIDPEINFTLVLRPQFTEDQQEKILLLSLLAKADAPAHIRAYIGIGDNTNFAEEVRTVKEKYGSVNASLQNANPEDWPKAKKRIRKVCERLSHLRELLRSYSNSRSVENVLDHLFPEDSKFGWLRRIFNALCEADDTLPVLYRKFQDYIRIIPTNDSSVRVMTLMASKGLEAKHVYIIGCNAGNIPGENRSPTLEDYQHKAEQRRLLYVGFTRAQVSLTVSWSRYILFQQSKGQHTESVATRRIAGRTVSEVGLSEFLQDLPNISWE